MRRCVPVRARPAVSRVADVDPTLPSRTTTAAPVPAFEDDLRLNREARGRTLEQVQQETRIPVDVLKRFENGSLAGDPTYNAVYLKAFLRSYARAVGVPQAAAVAAYEAARGGTYRGELNPSFVPPPEPVLKAPAPAGPAPAEPLRAPEAPVFAEPPPLRAPPPPPPPSPSPPPRSPVNALREGPPEPPTPPVVGERVRPSVRGARRSYDKNWLSILGLTAAAVVALAAALWFLVFREADPPGETLATAADVATQIDSTGIGAGAAGGGPRFQRPIALSVAATGDGLQSFRVSLDAGERSPFWINAGESRTFTADSSLTIWGEGTAATFADAALELQGIRWTPADGQALTISPATGQRLLDSLSAAAGAAGAAQDLAP